MKIIKSGRPELRKLFFNCHSCGCEFEASEEETNMLPRNGSYIWCECPECGAGTGAVLQDVSGDLVRPRFKESVRNEMWFYCPTCLCEFEFYGLKGRKCPKCGQKFKFC